MSGLSLLYNALPFISGVVSIWLGCTVLFSDRRNKERLSFFLFAISMGLWGVFISTFLLSESPGWAYWSAVLYYISAILLIYGFTVYCIVQYTNKLWSWLFLGVPVVAMIIGMLVTGGVVSTVSVSPDALNSVELHPVWYALYCYIFTIYSGVAFFVLVRSVRNEVSALRRLQRILIGKVMVVCLPAGALFNLILPLFGDYSLIMVGPVFALPIVVVVFYAMMRHQLFDIRTAVVRTASYSLVIATMGVLYFVLAFIVSELFSTVSNSTFMMAIITIILVIAFQPLKQFFDYITRKIFYRNSYSIEEFMSGMGEILGATTDLHTLLRRVSIYFGERLGVERVAFFIHKNDNRHANGGVGEYSKLRPRDIEVLDAYAETNDIILLSQADESDLREMLRRTHTSFVVPLRRDGVRLGYLYFGERFNGAYTARDIKTIQSVLSELSIAIQNALSVQEVKDLNESLQQRIDDATKELRESNEKLQRLDAAKDEFVSMASHQLRTPLTSVKGYISMVLEGDAGDITEMQSKLLGEAFTSSERMVHLINDFLNVSRLQTGKFMIDRRKVDLSKVVAQEVQSLQSTAQAHDITLKYRQPSVFPMLYLDEGKLRQVIMNFIDNAFYYSREFSTVTVKVAAVGPEVVVTVTDTGMGVPASEQKRLFTKFFRATNARKQRPDGTGVGLFLAKKVVLAHGGSMIFESEEGKGSTFGFRLPIKRLANAPADGADELAQ